MTKTTSYEISKKLKIAGFETSYVYAWYIDSEGSSWIQEIQHVKPTATNRDGKEVKLTFIAPAYELETILESICFVIQDIEKDKNYWFVMNHQDLNYMSFDGETNIDFYTPRQKNESLADTAGRLLLLLHEKNLIKF